MYLRLYMKIQTGGCEREKAENKEFPMLSSNGSNLSKFFFNVYFIQLILCDVRFIYVND